MTVSMRLLMILLFLQVSVGIPGRMLPPWLFWVPQSIKLPSLPSKLHQPQPMLMPE